MFERALLFDQDIGNWDVLTGVAFVSIVVINTKNTAMYDESTHHILILYTGLHVFKCIVI